MLVCDPLQKNMSLCYINLEIIKGLSINSHHNRRTSPCGSQIGSFRGWKVKGPQITPNQWRNNNTFHIRDLHVNFCHWYNEIFHRQRVKREELISAYNKHPFTTIIQRKEHVISITVNTIFFACNNTTFFACNNTTFLHVTTSPFLHVTTQLFCM